MTTTERGENESGWRGTAKAQKAQDRNENKKTLSAANWVFVTDCLSVWLITIVHDFKWGRMLPNFRPRSVLRALSDSFAYQLVFRSAANGSFITLLESTTSAVE